MSIRSYQVAEKRLNFKKANIETTINNIQKYRMQFHIDSRTYNSLVRVPKADEFVANVVKKQKTAKSICENPANASNSFKTVVKDLSGKILKLIRR